MKKISLKRITKNDNEEIRITTLRYRDEDFIDLRVFAELTSSEWLPTQKGFIVSRELLEEMVAGLNEALNATS